MNISNDKKFLIFLVICFLIYLQGVFELPVLDRDEARFATASKTMLLEKEFIDIQLVDEKRYKKPIGIYWFQSLANYIFGDYPFDKIWIYRIPSLLGIFISMILIYYFVKRFENSKIAFLSVVFLIFSILTISEIHQSKTDGLLFLFIGLCNLIIYELIKSGKISFNQVLIFWISLALGVLTKGPIIIIFTIIPLLVFSFFKKKNYFIYFFSIPSIITFFIITLPWFILISYKSEGLFWYESVGIDLLKKVRSGQESHGFPPGYYSILLFIFFWPGSLFIINLVDQIRKNFKKIIKLKDFEFYLIISFLIPFLLYELIPTKLPHYIFAAYLPLSILISKYIIDNSFNKNVLKFSFFPLIIYPLTLISAIAFAVFEYSIIDFSFLIIFISLIIYSLFLIWVKFNCSVISLIAYSGLFQILTYLILVFFLMPRLEKLWVSEKISDIILSYDEHIDHFLITGFNEPSLLFLTSHKSKLINDLDLSKAKMKNEKILFFIVEKSDRKIKDELQLNEFKLLKKFSGFNYSKGQDIIIRVYKN